MAKVSNQISSRKQAAYPGEMKERTSFFVHKKEASYFFFFAR
jgi:hypothetical protein